MSYTTRQELISRYGETQLRQLTDRELLGVIDDEVLERAMADADAEIDGYLAARYQLPLPTVPVVLARIAADITRFNLYQTQAPDEVRKRYEDARKLLEGLSSGRVSLGLSESDDRPTPSLASASAGSVRVFGRANTGGY